MTYRGLAVHALLLIALETVGIGDHPCERIIAGRTDACVNANVSL